MVANQNRAYQAADAVLRGVLRRLPPSSLNERAALTWGYRFRPPPRTVKLRSGMRFHFESVDFLPLLLHYTGIFEPHVIGLMRRLLRPRDIVLDVGANIGFHTLESWRAVGRNGRVISIEASPEHAAATRRNLEANNLPTTDVINIAVGEEDGTVVLGRPEGGNDGMFGINAGSDDAFTVPMRRIDDLLDVPRLNLIKMDIEGSELGALRGATETIRRHRPAILIELNDVALRRCGATSAEVVALLHELGYSGQVISGGGLRPIADNEAHVCDECLFLPYGCSAAR